MTDSRMDGWSAQQVRDRFGIPPEVEVQECGSEFALYEVAYGDLYEKCVRPVGHEGSHSPITEPNPEHVYGIGAHDSRIYDASSAFAFLLGGPYPWMEAGEMFAMARRGANLMRARAYESGRWPPNPLFLLTHLPNGASKGEIKWGIPALWKVPEHDYDGWVEE